MKIEVAIPVYDGKLPAETARCLLDEQVVALGSGDLISVRFLPNCSHPAMGRNQLARHFMESSADRLVFLDSDVTFQPGALVRIARHPVDFVGGCYRLKLDEEAYPMGWIDGPTRGLKLNDFSGLIEVSGIPGGFMSLSRKVFETMKAAHPERTFTHRGETFHIYFATPAGGGVIWGEDAYFCKEWRELSGKVYLDPEIPLTHWDFNKPFPGHIGNWLKRQNGIPVQPNAAV